MIIAFVVDGLRPDAITPEDTPTLYRLRGEGVCCANSHAVFPTVTRVNAAAISTGMQPARHGIVGNQLYVPAVDPRRAFDTGNYRNLARLDEATGGRLLLAPTLAERVHARGLRLAGVSSGSTGSALLLNPQARAGVGALVNGYLDPGRRVAYPDEASRAILERFGPPPPKASGERYDGAVAWTQRVLREYVLPELEPDVVLNWLTEPDHSLHNLGVGAAGARAALQADDREIAGVLEALGALGRLDTAAVLVLSDHGFSTNTAGVDVAGALVEAGLKAAPDSDDVVLASSGQAVGLHVAGRDRARIERIARLIQSRDWGGVVFTAERGPGDTRGTAEGTFSLELIHLASAERGPDLVLTFPWTSGVNAFGVAGADLACISGGARLYAADHGSMSPWNVRNTFVLWGAGVKRGVTVRAPVGNADAAPTIRALLGLPGEGLDGRVLAEALAGGPDAEQLPVETRTHVVEAGAYRAAIQVTTADGRRYLDKSWRVR